MRQRIIGVTRRGVWKVVALAALITLLASSSVAARGDARLATIGPAPSFTLTTQYGSQLTLRALRGKVVVLTFLNTHCAECPLLTAKMVSVQDKLGRDFGPRVFFTAVTVDPERDTPPVLLRYAAAHRVNPAGWAFLTGTPEDITEVGRKYGITAKKGPRGDIDHTFITSLIDRDGVLRVQYVGVRFDPIAVLSDVLNLLREPPAR